MASSELENLSTIFGAITVVGKGTVAQASSIPASPAHVTDTVIHSDADPQMP